MRLLTSLTTMLVLGVLIAGCGRETAVQPKPEPAPPVDEPVGQDTAYPYTAPFTGLGSKEKLDGRRPIMVMINNQTQARPQSGLDKADIVYEILAEGEITRFEAIYQSQKPQVIGPVRSIRPYYIKIGEGFDAVMVHVGGSEEALATLAGPNYADLDEIANSKYFWRESFRKPPHNVYTDLDKINQAIEAKGFRTTSELPHFPFLPADAKITEGSPATDISVKFHSLYSASYKYDEEKGRYLRFSDGKPHMDLTTNEQLAVTNLLVISSKHRVIDSEGRRTVDVTGPGDGYLFQQGKARSVKWKRSGGVIRAYTDATYSEEVPLLPGNTWVNFVPDSPGLQTAVQFQ
ncbi:DUF3048 domain-containing protein [Brevibacillus sp. B_LB10_24]|uniref:DUF3048 domain-containing protein n=1 Tax=Brevibacillus sp. B_LB10_24 TaxID=3380645 RepID=UPI0038B8AD3E